MATAAILQRIQQHMPDNFGNTAPGHRFLLYFPVWNEADWGVSKAARTRALQQCVSMQASIPQLQAIRTRQQTLFKHYGASGLCISATSTAPFATGLGNEHPIENGFAFLTPYGLPYLAGSGVKGILRRAMQELRDDGKDGFTVSAIDALFGPENIQQPEDARRGALDFWDVFPLPAGNKLCVEIMTPHFGGYYKGGEHGQTPHDAGQPVPVSFLAVPAKSEFDFYVVCHPQRLPEHLRDAWRSLLEQAFAHAFDWVGFGAKTSVGYGAMRAKITQPATVSSVEKGTSSNQLEWPAATLILNKGTGEIKASFEGKTTAGLKGDGARKLQAALGAEHLTKLQKKTELKGVAVLVEQQGNLLLLRGLAP